MYRKMHRHCAQIYVDFHGSYLVRGSCYEDWPGPGRPPVDIARQPVLRGGGSRGQSGRRSEEGPRRFSEFLQWFLNNLTHWNERWKGKKILFPDFLIHLFKNKYGSVQELRSTFGHLKSFKILCWNQFGLVGSDLFWLFLVWFCWFWFGLVGLVLIWFGCFWFSLVKFGLVNFFYWVWLRMIWFTWA